MRPAGPFFSVFAAATVLPTASGAVRVGLLTDTYSVGLLLVATLGNVPGSVANWMLGGRIERYIFYSCLRPPDKGQSHFSSETTDLRRYAPS